MKHLVGIVALGLLLATASGPAAAGPPAGSGPAARSSGQQGAWRDLDLTPRQREQIKALRAEMRQKGQGLDRKARRQLHRDFVQQVMSLLTPEQKAKLQAQAVKGRRSGGER